MLRNTYTHTTSLDFTASTAVRLDLPESGYITQLELLVTLTYDTGSAVSAKEDAISRLLSAVRMQSSGGKKFLDINDGRQLKYWDYFHTEGQIMEDTLSSTTSQTGEVSYANYIVHLGYDWTDEFDPTIPVPAVTLNNFELEVTWGSSSTLGTGYTVTAASTNIQVTIHELTLEAGETEADFWPDGIIDPRVEARNISISEVATNLGLESNVPTGDMIYETLMIQYDSSDDRSDTNVTDVGIKFPKERRTPIDLKWRAIKGRTRSKFRLTSDVTGATMFSWEWLTGRAVGLDLRAAQVGDVRFGFTTSVASGSIDLVHFMMG